MTDDAPRHTTTALTRRLEGLRERARIPALAAVVARQGSAPRLASVGRVDPRASDPATLDTVFAWYSITKIVTACVALRLAESGFLDLDAPVSETVPQVAPLVRGRGPTPRDLLCHGGGFVDRQMHVARWFRQPGDPWPDPREFLAVQLSRHGRLKREPRQALHYSNLGFALLGECLAAAGGLPFRQLVRDEVLDPLGCVATGFEGAAIPEGRQAVGLLPRWSTMGLAVAMVGRGRFTTGRLAGVEGAGRSPTFGSQSVVRWRDLVFSAHGGLLGPISDLARLVDAFVQGGAPLLDPESVAAMGELVLAEGAGAGRTRGTGLGFFIDLEPQGLPGRGRLLSHGGRGPGFTTEFFWLPEAGMGVGVLGSGSFDCKAVARALLLEA